MVFGTSFGTHSGPTSRPGGPGSTEISTKSQIGVSPDPPHASRMLHGGHIRHLVCLLGHPGPPFEIVL